MYFKLNRILFEQICIFGIGTWPAENVIVLPVVGEHEIPFAIQSITFEEEINRFSITKFPFYCSELVFPEIFT